MRKLIIVLFLFSAVCPILVLAQDAGMPDSVIFGNLDGSPIYSDRVVHLPVWFKNDEDLDYMILSVGIDTAYGRIGQNRTFYYPINTWNCFDTIYSRSPYDDYPGYSFMVMYLWTEGPPLPPLNTDSSWQRIMTFDFMLNSDTSLIGDTTCTVAFWSGITAVSSGCIIVGSPSGTDDTPLTPAAFSLSQNYPNPFNAQTTISYSLPTACDVTIDIFDILGRKISTLAQGHQSAGSHSIIWDACDAASGIYIYRINASGYKETRQMVLLK